MRIWIILVLIGIFFLGTQYAYAQVATLETPINLSNNIQDDQINEAIIASSGDNVYVFWRNQFLSLSGEDKLFFARSANQGQSFFTPVQIGADNSAFIDMVVAGSNVYLVYRDGTSSDVFFIKSENNGVTLSTPLNISNSGLPPTPVFTEIAVSGNNVYVIWEEVIGTLRFVASTDNGDNFSSPVTPTGAETVDFSKKKRR